MGPRRAVADGAADDSGRRPAGGVLGALTGVGVMAAVFTIITTAANELMAKIHDRMPVILSRQDYALWLDPEVQGTERVTPLLKPYPAEEMEAYPVSTRVNSPRNDGPELLEPVVTTGEQAGLF